VRVGSSAAGDRHAHLAPARRRSVWGFVVNLLQRNDSGLRLGDPDQSGGAGRGQSLGS
jgi:hypothetical protein